MRNDFVVELDNRVIKTSLYESHTGNLAPRSTSLLNRILVGRRVDDDKQTRFQTAWFLGLIAGSDEVIALHPDGVQRHHGEWRVSPLDDPESNLRELKSALALMTEVDWRPPWVQDVSRCAISQRLALCGMQRTSSSSDGTGHDVACRGQRNDFWTLVQMTHVMTTSQSDTKALTTLCRWHRSLLLDLV